MTVGFLRWFTIGMAPLGFGLATASAASRHDLDDGARTSAFSEPDSPRVALNIVYCLAPA